MITLNSGVSRWTGASDATWGVCAGGVINTPSVVFRTFVNVYNMT